MDTLLWPLKVAVAWVMVTIHKALILFGFPDGPGIAWVLSIIGLTIVVRLLMKDEDRLAPKTLEAWTCLASSWVSGPIEGRP